MRSLTVHTGLLALLCLSAHACAEPLPKDDDTMEESDTLAQQIPESEGISAPLDGGAAPPTNDCDYRYADYYVAREGNRVLTSGSDRWVLFDTDTRRAIASGASWMEPKIIGATTGPIGQFGDVALAGGRALVAGRHEVDGKVVARGALLLDARNGGSVIANIGGDLRLSGVGLARDGSYVWGYDSKNLYLWSADGLLITSTPGFYMGAQFNPAPDKLHVLLDPRGEQVSIRTGAVQVIPERNSPATPAPSQLSRTWFEDGRHYVEITDRSDRYGLFTPDHRLVQEVGPSERLKFRFLAGSGDYYWGSVAGSSYLSLFRVGGALTDARRPVPVEGFPTDSFMSNTLQGRRSVLINSVRGLTLVDLRGATPVYSALVLPPPQRSLFGVYASDSETRWALVRDGLIYASEGPIGTPFHLLGCRAP